MCTLNSFFCFHPLLVVSWHFRKVWFQLQEGPGWHQIARWFSMWVWNIYQVLKPMKSKTIYISVWRNSLSFFSLDKIQAGKEMHNVSTLHCNCAQTLILFSPLPFPYHVTKRNDTIDGEWDWFVTSGYLYCYQI